MLLLRKISVAISLILAAYLLTVPVFAETGSITIKLQDSSGNTSLQGVEFQIHKVADEINGEYVLLKEYQIVDLDLNRMNHAKEMEDAARKLQMRAVGGRKATVGLDGKVTIPDLEKGVYLGYVRNISDNHIITPFLVSIPAYDSKSLSMQYDVEVLPKYTYLSKEKPMKTTEVKTGDDQGVIVYGVLILNAVLLVGILITIRKRKEKNTR